VTKVTKVKLNGLASTDANFDRFTYAWSLSSVLTGSTATLTVDPTNAAKSTFTPTAVGVYVATLIVTDVRGASSPPITVVITVTL
jgi:hypothetical protein